MYILLFLLLLIPSIASAQVGVWISLPNTTCANDSRLTAPVQKQTVCFDSVSNQWFIWNGSAWVTGTLSLAILSSPTITGTVSGTPAWASGQTLPNLTLTSPLTGANGGTGIANTGFTIGNAPTAPGSPIQGNTFWLNPTLNGLYGYDGTGFQSEAALTTKTINVLDPRWGAKCDGATDDTSALNAAFAVPNTAVVIPSGKVCLANGQLTANQTGVTIIGPGATIKAGASVAGNSSVLKITGTINNVRVYGLTFDANQLRRFGLDISDANVTLWAVQDTDAKGATDIFGRQIVTTGGLGDRATARGQTLGLRLTDHLKLVDNVSPAAAGGGTLASGTYSVEVAAVDALGREGPMFPVVAGGLQITLTGAAGSNAIALTWTAPQPGAKSYRIYLRDPNIATSGDWTVYFPISDPTVNSFTITTSPGKTPVGFTATSSAGTFNGPANELWAFQVSAYFSNAVTQATNQSSQGAQLVSLVGTSNIGALSWTAVAGATGYRVHIANGHWGNYRNYLDEIDVGNVTSYNYTGQASTYGRNFGSQDDAAGDEINVSAIHQFGQSKSVFQGDIQLIAPILSTENQLQFVTFQQVGSSPSSGFQWRHVPSGGGAQVSDWTLLQKDAPPSNILRWTYVPNTQDYFILDGANNKATIGAANSFTLFSGATLTTGATAGDIIVPHSNALRFINNAGTNSSNYRIGPAGAGSDTMDIVVPSGQTIRFQDANGTMATITGGAGLNLTTSLSMNGTQITNADAAPKLLNIGGISTGATKANNLRGSCTFAAATTCTVTFGTAEPDANYFPALGCNANKTFWWSALGTGGFTINASASSSDICAWHLVR